MIFSMMFSPLVRGMMRRPKYGQLYGWPLLGIVSMETSNRMMATRRTPRSMRNKKKKRNEFELEDDDDNVDLANEEVDPFGGRATTEELKEYGSFGAYHEEYQDATQNVDERPAAPTKPTKPKVSKVGVDEDTEFDPYKRTIFGVGEEG